MPIVQGDTIPAGRLVDVVSFNTNSAFACCNAALNSGPDGIAAPQIFLYFKGANDAIGLCQIFGDETTCGNSQADFMFSAMNREQAGGPAQPSDGAGEVAIGNARCGEFVGPQVTQPTNK
jgi:hypothetical protein